MKLGQLIEIAQLQESDYDTLTDYQVEIVSIFHDLDPDLVYEWSVDKLNQAVNIITKILNAESKSKEIIQVGDYQFQKLDFNNLSLGAFIDIEYFLKRPAGILELVTIIYREIVSPANDLRPVELEEYGTWVMHRTQVMKGVDVQDVVGLKNEYATWRRSLQESYAGLFQYEYEEDEEEEEITGSKLEAAKAKQAEIEKESFVWESVLLKLSNGDVSRYATILKMPVILIFNLLSALKVNSE